MVISGANTYTGATNITAGTLKLGVSSSSSTSGPVGTNAGGVIVSSGATFDLNGFSLTSSATEALSLSGTGVGGNGALVNNAATTSTYIGVITFTAAAKISGENGLIAITGTPASGTTGITLSGATGGSISTVIAGNRTLSKEDVGNWTLSGNNTYSGATTISAGKIVLNPGSNATPATQYILNGGSISTQGITANRTITSSKTLRLDDNSEINLGSTAHTLTFATSNGETWATNKQLTITGWVGGYNGTAGTAGKIFIGNSASGLTSSQLLKIQFYDGATYYPAMLLSTGQLVPFSNTIATGTISNSTFCEGETGINVPFTYSSASSFTGATFTAQLSNSTGSFTSPVILQSVASNGSGSQSISVTIPLGTAAGSAYRIRVVSNTPAVNGSDNGSNLTVNVYPSAAGSISGSSSVCQGQSGVSYTVGTISNAATYSWSYTGTGASISGTGNSVSISFSASATAGDLTVMGVNSCGNGSVSATFPVSVNPLPNAAGIITGTTLVSQGQTNVGFSVGNISNATSYVWSYSGSGATISGSGSSITISFSGSASSGNVSVYGQNSCGNGTASTFAVTVAGNKVSISSGSWYTSSNWSPSGVPTATDNVTISHAITLDNTPTAICNNLTLGVSGTLQIYGGFSLTVNGTLTNNAGEYGLIINSDGSLLNNTAGVSATVERYITNDNKWHFISSPVANQAIWPEFAPDPGSGLNFGTSWNWDFYYWNPNSFLANNLYWVNLRKNTAGDYNNSNVDQGGSYAGFGTTTPPTFTSGRGYLVAYNSNWNPSTGSPEYHYFGGSLHAGTVNRNIVTGANYFNLVGNPFASSIDWKASSGWSRSALESSGGGYDYWIYNDNLSTGNYGVFNSSGTSGTNGVTRYIAPQQAFFVKAASDGVLGMGYEVRTHSSQSWLKGADAENSLVRLKITNDANSYSDEMIVEFNPEFTGGGSDKFWSFYASAPEIFVNKEGSNYSIARYRNTSEEQIINIGVKTGVQANYTLSASNINDFNLSNRVLLEDLVSGQVTDLKQNPSYTFEAGEGSNGNRFRLIIGSTIGIDEPGQNGFDIYANNGNLYLTNKEFKGVYTLRVSNLLGQTLLERQLDGSSAQLIRLNEVPGVYIATVHSNGKSFSQKFVIR
jgi:autotransporter-associated beta strand protein